MKTAIFAFSDKGCVLAKKISKEFENSTCYSIKKFADKHNIADTVDTQKTVGKNFAQNNCLIFVSAVGIAVRLIAPYIKNKVCDPAVISVDETAGFVIPILSGHIGGANEIAKKIAQATDAQAIITTATDINNRFSVDKWASENNLFISDILKAKDIQAQILTEDIFLKTSFKINGNLPNGVVNSDETIDISVNKPQLGFEITYQNAGDNLRLIPQIIYVGIGCKKDTSPQHLKEFFEKTLCDNAIDIRSIKAIASIEIKQNEPAILNLCKLYKFPFITYTAQQLNEVKGEFSGSQFVKTITGVDNVCERSAVLASDNGVLIVNKTADNGVTIALAVKKWEVSF